MMLPANPLQHLLLAQVDLPLVMTSGNASGKPPALSNAQATEQLGAIADRWLMHNRDIVQRADDSLVRLHHQGLFKSRAEMLRRARGYVPDALPLPPGFAGQPALLALGADLKTPFACCVMKTRWSASILAIWRTAMSNGSTASQSPCLRIFTVSPRRAGG